MTITPKCIAALGLAVALGYPASTAAADPPHTVDPSTMAPPLNPDFGPWTCFEAGTGVTCQGYKDVTYSFPLELECDGKPVYVAGEEHSATTRWHTLDGLAVKTELRAHWSEAFSLSPIGDGPTVVGAASLHRHYDYPVPGDRDSRVLTETGSSSLRSRTEGLLMHDAGTITYVPGGDDEIVDEMHGIHDRFEPDIFPDDIICSALTGR